MSDHMHSGSLDDRWKLREAVNALCTESDGPFVKGLAAGSARVTNRADGRGLRPVGKI